MGFFSKLKKTLLKTPLGGLSGLVVPSLKITPKLFIEQPAKAIVRTAVLTGGAIAVLNPALIIPVAKSVIPKTILGKVSAVFTGIVGTTILTKSKKARKVVTQAPETFIKTGITGGTIIAKTIETGKPEVGIKEALITGGLLAGGVVVGVAVAKAVKGIKKQHIIIPPIGEQLITEKAIGIERQVPLTPEKAIGIERQVPLTPETATITTGKKPYKRRRAKKTPSIRQSVRINIVNKPRNTGVRITNKRYLNRDLLC